MQSRVADDFDPRDPWGTHPWYSDALTTPAWMISRRPFVSWVRVRFFDRPRPRARTRRVRVVRRGAIARAPDEPAPSQRSECAIRGAL
jgi:hypothetical protein